MIALILVYVLILLGVVFITFECWKQYVNHTKLKNFIVLKSPPVVGNLIDLLMCDHVQIMDFPSTMMTKYKVSIDARQIFMWMGPSLWMMTGHPDTFGHILNSDKAIKKAYMYEFFRLERSLFVAEPNEWKIHRKALNPTIGPKMLGTFLPIFNEKSKKMVDLMERYVGTPIDMHLIAFKAAVDIVFSASFDVDWSVQNSKGDEIRNMMFEVFERFQSRSQSILMKPNFVYKLTNDYQLDNEQYGKFCRFVQSAREAKKLDLAEKMVHGIDELAIVKEQNNPNYLQKCLQMESERKFDDDEVIQEMYFIIIASGDTTALTLRATILMLAIHPEYQDRVVDELRSIFKDVDEPVTNDHIQQMRYLELIIKESLRLFPVAPYLGRQATEDIPMDGGIVPKGTQILMSVFKTHRCPIWYGENAHEFYPERFLPENCSHWHPYQYIPFSAGLRNCMGIRYAWASLKVSLAYLLRRYKFTSHLKMEDVEVKAGGFLSIVNKDPIRLELRKW